MQLGLGFGLTSMLLAGVFPSSAHHKSDSITTFNGCVFIGLVMYTMLHGFVQLALEHNRDLQPMVKKYAETYTRVSAIV